MAVFLPLFLNRTEARAALEKCEPFETCAQKYNINSESAALFLQELLRSGALELPKRRPARRRAILESDTSESSDSEVGTPDNDAIWVLCGDIKGRRAYLLPTHFHDPESVCEGTWCWTWEDLVEDAAENTENARLRRLFEGLGDDHPPALAFSNHEQRFDVGELTCARFGDHAEGNEWTWTRVHEVAFYDACTHEITSVRQGCAEENRARLRQQAHDLLTQMIHRGWAAKADYWWTFFAEMHTNGRVWATRPQRQPRAKGQCGACLQTRALTVRVTTPGVAPDCRLLGAHCAQLLALCPSLMAYALHNAGSDDSARADMDAARTLLAH